MSRDHFVVEELRVSDWQKIMQQQSYFEARNPSFCHFQSTCGGSRRDVGDKETNVPQIQICPWSRLRHPPVHLFQNRQGKYGEQQKDRVAV